MWVHRKVSSNVKVSLWRSISAPRVQMQSHEHSVTSPRLWPLCVCECMTVFMFWLRAGSLVGFCSSVFVCALSLSLSPVWDLGACLLRAPLTPEPHPHQHTWPASAICHSFLGEVQTSGLCWVVVKQCICLVTHQPLWSVCLWRLKPVLSSAFATQPETPCLPSRLGHFPVCSVRKPASSLFVFPALDQGKNPPLRPKFPAQFPCSINCVTLQRSAFGSFSLPGIVTEVTWGRLVCDLTWH